MLKPVSEPEAVLANDIYLSYASGMERLFLDLSAIEHHVHSFRRVQPLSIGPEFS